MMISSLFKAERKKEKVNQSSSWHFLFPTTGSPGVAVAVGDDDDGGAVR